MDSLQKQLAAAGDDSDGRMTGMSEGQAANAIVTLAPPPLPSKVPHSARHAIKSFCRVLLSHAASC